MTKDNGLGDNLAVGGTNVGGDTNSIGRIYGGPVALPMTDITQRAMARQAGLRDGGMEFLAYFDPATGASHDRFAALPTADTLATYWHGAAIGNPAASCVAKQIDYSPNRGADGSLLFTIPVQANGYGLEWGVLGTAGVRTDGAATNGATLDLGSAPAGAFGLQAYMQLFAFTGTSVTAKLQHSSDNNVGDPWADIAGGGFTAATAAGWQRIATAAISIKQYIRVVTTGTFSNAAFLIQVTRNGAATVF